MHYASAGLGGIMSNNVAYESLTLSHPFMFGKIAMDKKNSQIILSSLLNEDIILKDNPTREKFIQIKSESKFVRLDLFSEDIIDRLFDTEMQNKSKNPEINKELPKRCRYYQSIIDAEILDTGIHYKYLNKSYIIFICTFDPFGEGLYRYTFQNRCDENTQLTLGDECIKIFYNTKGDLSKAPQKTREFLEYIENQTVANSDIQVLHDAVTVGNQNEEWRAEFMRLNLWEMDARENGHAEGHAEGLAEGLAVKLISQIKKKIEKGKTATEIADDLEEELTVVQSLYEIIQQNPQLESSELLKLIPSELK